MEVKSFKKNDMYKKAIKSRNWDIEQPTEYKLIPLTKGMFAKVDNDDFDLLKNINWSYSYYGYALNSTIGLMHRIILGVEDSHIDVDHINGDKIDNRKSNIRICTRSNNLINTGYKGGISIYKGVSWHSQRGKFRAYGRKNNKQIHLGLFDKEEDTALVYNEFAINEYGEFARLNKIID